MSRNKRQKRTQKKSFSNKFQPKKNPQNSNFSRPKFKGFGRHKESHGTFERTQEEETIHNQRSQETIQKINAWHEESKKLRESGFEEPKDLRDLALDDWQQEVLDHLVAFKSVVVDAPTTAGKTRAVEVYFARNINNPRFRAVYTTPVKSLANDKLREFREKFGPSCVGIATGDIKENLDAPIVVATLETYRNSLLGVEPDLGRTLAVFDEYHYIQDPSRGSAWEEAMILTPESCQILLLSASVENSHQFAEWLTFVRRKPCEYVKVTHRPVPLTHLVYFDGNWISADLLTKKDFTRADKRLMSRPIFSNKTLERAAKLTELGLSPTLIYCGKRLACYNLAKEMVGYLQPIDREAAGKIGEVLEDHHNKMQVFKFMDREIRQMIQVYGIAYHHSGLAPAVRFAIESLLKKGLLRFTFATMGLSLGVNFSVRSAVVSDYERPGDNGLVQYPPSEILQMIGRAGRRGRDVVGYACWPSLESFLKFGDAKRERIVSAMRSDPATILGLCAQKLTTNDIQKFYDLSFSHFANHSDPEEIVDLKYINDTLGFAKPACVFPLDALAQFYKEKSQEGPAKSPCNECRYRKPCHNVMNKKIGFPNLTSMLIHLNRVGCLNYDTELTELGEIAKYFPQNGGLVLSQFIRDGEISYRNLGQACEIFACYSTSYYKQIHSKSYQVPFGKQRLVSLFRQAYPKHLFNELYSMEKGQEMIRDFNPDAGYILKLWISGISWRDLLKEVETEFYTDGDIVHLIYRVASYLQSVASLNDRDMAYAAISLRELLLREPLSIGLD